MIAFVVFFAYATNLFIPKYVDRFTIDQSKIPTPTPSELPLVKSTPVKFQDPFKYGDWIDDASSALYYTFNGIDKTIWVQNKSGAVSKLIWTDAEVNYISMNWSPDGKKLAFYAYFTLGGANGMYIYDSDKQKVVAFLPSKLSNPDDVPSSTTYQSWSQDSRYFAYLNNVAPEGSDITIYDTNDDVLLDVFAPYGENKKGPLYWDKNNNLYFISFNPIEHCSTAVPVCPGREISLENSVFSIIKLNVQNNKIEKVYGRKIPDGGLDSYVLDEKENAIFFHGRNSPSGDSGTENVPLFKLDLNSKEVSPLGAKAHLAGDTNLSPDKTKIAVSSTFYTRGLGTIIYSLPDFQILFNNIDATKQEIFSGWLNNNVVLIKKEGGLFKYNIHTKAESLYLDSDPMISIRHLQ